MADPLLPWAPFFYSFGPSLFIIKILADWLKVRLYYPLSPGDQKHTFLKARVATRPRNGKAEEASRFEEMSYNQLRKYLEASGMQVQEIVPPSKAGLHQPDFEFVTSTGDRVIAEAKAIYASKAETRYHIHHFVFGIPLMFVSWGLFVYAEGWWGLLVAGVVAALFLSELKELITQQWQP